MPWYKCTDTSAPYQLADVTWLMLYLTMLNFISRRMFEQSHPSLSDDDDFQFPATSVGPANTETVRKN